MPMGSAVAQNSNPRFRAKVIGLFKQLPGCPDYVVDTLEAKHLEKMSLGECYNPSDERYLIERIEVIKIRPQAFSGDNLRTTFDDNGKAIATEPYFGDFRTAEKDDCQNPGSQRAWSSPIFVDYQQ